jgi:hypothetical protein
MRNDEKEASLNVLVLEEKMKSMRLLRSSVIQTLILAFLTVCAPLLWAQGPPQWVEGRILI